MSHSVNMHAQLLVSIEVGRIYAILSLQEHTSMYMVRITGQGCGETATRECDKCQRISSDKACHFPK